MVVMLLMKKMIMVLLIVDDSNINDDDVDYNEDDDGNDHPNTHLHKYHLSHLQQSDFLKVAIEQECQQIPHPATRQLRQPGGGRLLLSISFYIA